MPETKPVITIRKLNGVEELRQVQRLEKEVWQLADIDVLPLTWAIASIEAGAIWLGALVENKIVGFAFAFPGLNHGCVAFHSHQLAVAPQYRDSNLGYKLKLAQRENVLALELGCKPAGTEGIAGQGAPGRKPAIAPPLSQSKISEISWTFDPLQSKNAHLNFFKLGVVCDSYKVDLYGPGTSSMLHRNGTDRLWVRWPIRSHHVIERVGEKKISDRNLRAEILDALGTVQPLIVFSGEGRPVQSDLEIALRRQRIAIEIPSDIGAIEKNDPGLAREWRGATRWAFSESLHAGFHVAEFCRTVRGQQGPGTYLLVHGTFEPDSTLR